MQPLLQCTHRRCLIGRKAIPPAVIHALADDGLLPLPGHTEAATTNWLHRRLPALKLEVVGFRAPMYLAADDRTSYWQQVEAIAHTACDRRVLRLTG